MLMNRDIYDKAGGFDKDLFLYCEDTDLQLRIKKLGYKIMCLPQVRIEHFTKSSVCSSGGDNIYQFNLHKSKLIYMKKHFNLFTRNIIRIAYILGFLIRIIVLPFRKKFKSFKINKFKQIIKILIIYTLPGNQLYFKS